MLVPQLIVGRRLIPGKASSLLIQGSLVVPGQPSGRWGRGQRGTELADPICSVVWSGRLGSGRCRAPRSIGASGGVGARPSALSGEVPAGHHSEETMQMNSTAWAFSPGTAQAHRGVPPSCAAHARGLKKERLTPDPRAFRGQRGSRRPRHGGRPFRERGRVSSWGRILPARVGQRGWDRRRFLPSVKAVLPQGRGEWACLLVKGSYFHVKGLFVFSARAAP